MRYEGDVRWRLLLLWTKRNFSNEAFRCNKDRSVGRLKTSGNHSNYYTMSQIIRECFCSHLRCFHTPERYSCYHNNVYQHNRIDHSSLCPVSCESCVRYKRFGRGTPLDAREQKLYDSYASIQYRRFVPPDTPLPLPPPPPPMCQPLILLATIASNELHVNEPAALLSA